MFRQSLKSLLVVSLFGLASCGSTQLAAAKHKESIPSTMLLAVVSVVELTPMEPTRESPSPEPGFEEGIGSWVDDAQTVDLITPIFPPLTELIIDLGIGEAPYDDGFLDYALDFSPLVGFSDALMQVEYRARVQPGTSVFGIAAMNRIQDETIMQAMDKNDWAWVGVGVQFSW